MLHDRYFPIRSASLAQSGIAKDDSYVVDADDDDGNRLEWVRRGNTCRKKLKIVFPSSSNTATSTLTFSSSSRYLFPPFLH